MRFDFNEANILKQNLYAPSDNRKVLLNRLDNVYHNTQDPILKKSVHGLIDKITKLSDGDVKRILYDILKKRFIVSSNYKVIHNK